MIYLGSKARIAKYILPIILKDRQSNQVYVEPFCGGMNTMCLVPGPKIANDVNPYLMAMWIDLQIGKLKLPDYIDREEYDFVQKNKEECRQSYVGMIGFCAGFGGRFFDGGFNAVGTKEKCNRIEDTINSLRKQIASFVDFNQTMLVCADYKEFGKIIPPNSIIYCDPPYQNTKGYSTGDFNHAEFWGWVRLQSIYGHTVYVSEYNAPEEFTCIWSKPVNTNIKGGQGIVNNIEKLFVYKG